MIPPWIKLLQQCWTLTYSVKKPKMKLPANACKRPHAQFTCVTCSLPAKKVCLLARVDVSETFSADQLWFRILSVLFQRCSLPENLWTALIQLWTAMKTEIFRAKNQRWNSADFLWNRADSELNSADFLWNRSETGNFQSRKISAQSELFQRWFSLKQSW